MAKKKASASDRSKTPETFEAALARLEKIVHELEEGQLSLSESLKLYEEGTAKLGRCRELLADAEQRIELLVGVDPDGAPETEPFDEESMTLEEKQARRSRRRSFEG